MVDCLRLKNMIFFGHHGLSPEEKKVGQRIEVDVELYLDLAPVGRTDNLAQGVNYTRVYELVREIVEKKSFSLLEAVAENLAAAILASFPVAWVVIRVRKPSPPVGGIMAGAEVEIVRPAGSPCPAVGPMV